MCNVANPYTEKMKLVVMICIMDELIHELIPVLRPSLADFGRIRRISRRLAALPLAIEPDRIHTRGHTLVSLEPAADSIILENGGRCHRFLKFRAPIRWEPPSFYIERGGALYRVYWAHIKILQALGYKILMAFNEFNHNGRLRRQFYYSGAVLSGSALQLIESGVGVYICAAGIVVSNNALVGDKLGVSYTRLHLCVPPPKSVWAPITSQDHN